MIPPKTPPRLPEEEFSIGPVLVGDPDSFVRRSETVWLRRAVVDPDALLDAIDMDRIADQGATASWVLGTAKQRARSPIDIRSMPLSGATLQVQDLQRYSSQISHACSDLASSLAGERVNCNLYVSPIPDRIGLAPHRDANDSFIVQLCGSKRWRVWNLREDWVQPGPEEAFVDVAEQRADHELVTDPGDVLFIPRGHVHAAECKLACSIHLTFGVYRPTVLDVLRWVVDDAMARKCWSDVLPWRLGGSSSAEQESLWKLSVPAGIRDLVARAEVSACGDADRPECKGRDG
jgi:hypothetical protein